jgi:hypothetical protein
MQGRWQQIRTLVSNFLSTLISDMKFTGVVREFTRSLEKWDYATRMTNDAWAKVHDYKQETVSDVSVYLQIRSRNALPNNSRFIDLYMISIPIMQVEWFQVSSTQFMCSLIMMYQLLTLRDVVV